MQENFGSSLLKINYETEMPISLASIFFFFFYNTHIYQTIYIADEGVSLFENQLFSGHMKSLPLPCTE